MEITKELVQAYKKENVMAWEYQDSQEVVKDYDKNKYTGEFEFYDTKTYELKLVEWEIGFSELDQGVEVYWRDGNTDRGHIENVYLNGGKYYNENNVELNI
jgi:hypothetical protein